MHKLLTHFMWMCVCARVRPSVCLSVNLSVCLFACLSLSPLFVHPSVRSFCLFVCLFCLSVRDGIFVCRRSCIYDIMLCNLMRCVYQLMMYVV